MPLEHLFFYFVDCRIMYTYIYGATLCSLVPKLAMELIGFRKLLATEVWTHLIINLIKHKSDSLIRKAFKQLGLLTLVGLFFGILMYMVGILLGFGINTGVTEATIVVASLSIVPISLLIALTMAYIVIGLMVAADVDHVTVVVYEAFTKKETPL